MRRRSVGRWQRALIPVLTATVLTATVMGAVGTVPAAAAAQTSSPQRHSVSVVPSTGTPWVQDGLVDAIVQVAGTVVVGGSFTTVSPSGGGTDLARSRVFAFTAATNAITAFAPKVNGTVNALFPGPDRASVYIAGSFTSVNGRPAPGLAFLSLETGRRIPGFAPPAVKGPVNDLQVVGGRLFLAGFFTTVGGVPHAGLASLNPKTGGLLPYLSVQLTGHHNWGVNCVPDGTRKCAFGRTGARSFSVSPGRRYLIVIGNFRNARNGRSGRAYDRDQIVRILLNPRGTAVDANWRTPAFTAPCHFRGLDSTVRKVAYSPDGSYVVVVTTGGHGGNCDSAVRLSNRASGVVPATWVSHTGGDSLYAVAVTATAVYVGGHERWANNPYGKNHAAPGAVPRPGLGALEPATGLPLTWDAGRNPRGFGVQALTLTSAGLWLGSDTEWVGNYQFERPRLAFFRFTSHTPAVARAATLPGNVVTVAPTTSGGAGLAGAHFDGSTAGNPYTPDSGGIAWDTARGAVDLGGRVVWAESDGTLHVRPFDGQAWTGTDRVVNPYLDSKWPAGLQGEQPDFYAELPQLTSLMFWGNRLYYTLQGQHDLRWRTFSADSLVVAPNEHTVTGHIDFSTVAGAFLANGTLYWADSGRADGLLKVAWNAGAPSANPVFVSTPGDDWRGRGLVVTG